MKTLDDLPAEVIQSIIFSIHRPLDHLAFFSSCPTINKAYNPTVCRALCAEYAIGRPLPMSDESWVKIFYRVMDHAKSCLISGCNHFDLPPPDRCWLLDNRFNPSASFPPTTEKRLVHVHLRRLGNTTFDDFLNGCWRKYIRKHGNIQPLPMSRVEDHPVIAMSFCCQPPIQATKVNMQVHDSSMNDALQIAVYNEDGITVNDVVESVQKWLDRPMTEKDRILAYKRLSDENEAFDHVVGCDNGERKECLCATYSTYGEFLDLWLNIEPGEPLSVEGIWGVNAGYGTEEERGFNLRIAGFTVEDLL